jgi:hypothetical protein
MKIFRSKLQKNLFIGSFVVEAIAFMLIMPYGSLDPSTRGFWACIIQSVMVTRSTIGLIYKAIDYATN